MASVRSKTFATRRPMPNKPRPENPARPIRFDVLWVDVERIAAEDETTPSEVVREAVRRYINYRKRKR